MQKHSRCDRAGHAETVKRPPNVGPIVGLSYDF